ncbi:MAG: response regulator [Bryobacteraceae bacterium]
MTIIHRSGPARILLAEDDRTAGRLIEIALKRTGIPHHLEIVTDGDQAIAVLSKEAPDLLLLDLYMPGKNGFEVLEHIKRRDHLRRIPVVMLSSSDFAEDINRAYDLHVNAYVKKPNDFADLSRALNSTIDFWLRTAETSRT